MNTLRSWITCLPIRIEYLNFNDNICEIKNVIVTLDAQDSRAKVTAHGKLLGTIRQFSSDRDITSDYEMIT